MEKYAAAGKVARIETRHKSARTIITVEDDGPGIPRDQRDRVFQPFHRLSDELVGPAGTGIGLSIARSLARMHGGDLTLQESDIGACFRVELHTPLVETKS